jgi:hypothetical protein
MNFGIDKRKDMSLAINLNIIKLINNVSTKHTARSLLQNGLAGPEEIQLSSKLTEE